MKKEQKGKDVNAPCWAVFITKAWGEKIEERQQSIPLSKQEAKEHMEVLRKMAKPMRHHYRMRKLPVARLLWRQTDQGTA
jgi:hypothetical protein